MMRYLLAGAATLALALSAAQADPGGNGKGNGGGGGNKHGNGHAAMSQGNGDAKIKHPGNQPKFVEKGPKYDKGPKKADTHSGNGPARTHPGNGNDNKIKTANRVVPGAARVDGPDHRDGVRVVTNGRHVITEPRQFCWSSINPEYQTYKGCPPGLDKKNNGCMPPGLAKKTAWYNAGWYDRDWYDGRDYRYHDGYLLRMDGRNRVTSYMPLLGGALTIGNSWPSGYQQIDLPTYYIDYYGLGDNGSYRYYDDTIYRVDPQSSVIRSIAALLTGEDFVIGRPLPMGYDVYNVPYPYRETYYDTPQYNYRYSDGYIYQVDPKTQLIMAAIDLLV